MDIEELGQVENVNTFCNDIFNTKEMKLRRKMYNIVCKNINGLKVKVKLESIISKFSVTHLRRGHVKT